MNKSTTITWIFLIMLTIASALISNLEGKYIVLLILVFAVLKFIGIAFQFMELKKAHAFWQVSVLVFLVLFITTLLILV